MILPYSVPQYAWSGMVMLRQSQNTHNLKNHEKCLCVHVPLKFSGLIKNNPSHFKIDSITKMSFKQNIWKYVEIYASQTRNQRYFKAFSKKKIFQKIFVWELWRTASQPQILWLRKTVADFHVRYVFVMKLRHWSNRQWSKIDKESLKLMHHKERRAKSAFQGMYSYAISQNQDLSVLTLHKKSYLPPTRYIFAAIFK